MTKSNTSGEIYELAVIIEGLAEYEEYVSGVTSLINHKQITIWPKPLFSICRTVILSDTLTKKNSSA